MRVFLTFFILSFLIYAPGLWAPFQFDDYLNIVENPAIKRLSRLDILWAYDPSRFLTHLTFSINYALGIFNVIGYHVVNIGLHAVVSWLVYLLIKNVLSQAVVKNQEIVSLKYHPPNNTLAWVTSLIFCCHPLQTQGVVYVSQRATLLASLFYLLTVLSYLRYRETFDLKFYVSSILTSFLGLFTKPIIISLPVILLLLESLFFFSKERRKERLIRLIPFFLMMLIVPMLLVLWKYKSFDLGLILEVTKETTRLTRLEYALTQLSVLLTYTKLIVWPISLNLDYDYPIYSSLWTFPVWFGGLVVVAAIALFVQLYRQHRFKLWAFGLGWIFITMALESSVFPIADVIFEHRLYLPMVGISLLGGIFFCKIEDLVEYVTKSAGGRFIPRRSLRYLPRFLPWVILFSVFTCWSFLSFKRTTLWADRIKFLEDMANKSPNKARVHNNLGIAYYEKGQLDKAKQSYLRAIALNTNFANPYNNLGNIFKDQQQFKEAEVAFNKALQLDRDYPGALYNLGHLYDQQKNSVLAEQFYKKAIQKKNDFTPAWIALGQIYFQRDELAQARFFFLEALRFSPENSLAHLNLGNVAIRQQRYAEAEDNYLKVIRLDSTNSFAYMNLGNLADRKQDLTQAVNFYQKALKLNPLLADAYFNLSQTLIKQQRFAQAKEYLTQAMKLYQKGGQLMMLSRCEDELKAMQKD